MGETNALLRAALNDAQQALVLAAIQTGAPIVIDGDRSQPTGKSTLCAELRALGAKAREAWEPEEGMIEPDNDSDRNSVAVVIRLNKGLFT